MGDVSRPLEIESTDIDTSKLSLGSVSIMRGMFPDQDDVTIARFLIARNGDLQKASDLLRGHLEWRSNPTNSVVLKSSILEELSKGKVYVRGTDNEGHPLLIYRVRFNIASERELETMAQSFLWWFAVALKSMPSHKSKVTVLIDRSDYRQENQDMDFMRHFSKIMQDNFPERLYRTIIYPTGFIFWGVWNIAKIFLDPVTQEKVKPMMQLAGVKQFVDPEFIPVAMGGECEYEFNIDHYDDPYTTEELEWAASTVGHPVLSPSVSSDGLVSGSGTVETDDS